MSLELEMISYLKIKFLQQGQKKKQNKQIPKLNLEDIFNNLDKMSNSSTLLEGINGENNSPFLFINNFRKDTIEEINDDNDNVINLIPTQNNELEVKLKNDEANNKNNQMLAKSLKVGSNKIYDQTAEIAKLKEEIRIKDSEIERLSLKITTMHCFPGKMDYQAAEEELDCTYHLAFMFSSPLVRRINSTVGIITQLDYFNEIRNIEKHLKGVNQEIIYKVEVATISNFRSVIADAPFALHFTGHGIKNDKNALGSTYSQFKDKGDILLLEDENGMADYLFQEDLK